MIVLGLRQHSLSIELQVGGSEESETNRSETAD